MRSKTVLAVLLSTAIGVVWVVGGCGGGSTGGGLQAGKGAVSGRIVDINSGQGIGGMSVTIGGQTDVSQTPDGSFIVRNIVPGTHDIVVTETQLFVLVGPIPPVVVPADATVNLSDPICVIDPNYLPPGRQ